MTKHDTILFFLSPHGRGFAANNKLAGICHYARAVGWRVQVLSTPKNPKEILSVLHEWHAIGCIVDVDSSHKYFSGRELTAVPTVFLDFSNKIISGNSFRVNHDPDEVGALAARHLSTCRLENYAFLGFPLKFSWSNARKKSFCRHLGGTAKTFSSFVLPYGAKPDSNTFRRLLAWLKHLPKPCGLMLATDFLAGYVYPICLQLGLRIPDDISVIGVDDDEQRCSNLQPPMTSVRLDFTQAGWMAAELLDRILQNPHLHPTVRCYHPLGITRRKSTIAQTPLGRQLAERAMKAIEESSGSCINVARLAKSVKCSRRLLEIRFRETYGMSVLDAIRKQRLEQVCRELRETDKPLAVVVAESGCRSESSFKRYFKSVTGLSMSEYRKRIREGVE